MHPASAAPPQRLCRGSPQRRGDPAGDLRAQAVAAALSAALLNALADPDAVALLDDESEGLPAGWVAGGDPVYPPPLYIVTSPLQEVRSFAALGGAALGGGAGANSSPAGRHSPSPEEPSGDSVVAFEGTPRQGSTQD